MRLMTAVFAATSGLALATATGATAYTVTPVADPANPTFTNLLGINNALTIGGFSGSPVSQGFTLTLPNSFTSQNFPSSTSSMVTGINNNGSTTGIYVGQQQPQRVGPAVHGGDPAGHHASPATHGPGSHHSPTASSASRPNGFTPPAASS